MNIEISIASAILAVIGLISIYTNKQIKKCIRIIILIVGLISILYINFLNKLMEKKYYSEIEKNKSLNIDNREISIYSNAIQDTLKNVFSTIKNNDKLSSNQKRNIINGISPIIRNDSIALENDHIVDLSKKDFLKVYLKNIEDYNKSTNFWISLTDEKFIWPLVNLYNKSEIRSITIPDDFEKGYINLIEVMDGNTNNNFFESKKSSVSKKILKSDKIKILIKTKINFN
jgi:hypothetical protein